MGIGQVIGKLWPRRADRPDAECDSAAEPHPPRERRAGEAASTACEGAARPPVDEQAGDSFLGYVD